MADIKLKDLRYLLAVADTRHFGKAAQRCFVSQPTLSAQLRKLEEYLGVTLIERQPRRVALTEAGQAVAARARVIVEASDEIGTLAHALRDPLAGKLRIGLLPTIGPYLLPQVALKLRKALPRLEVLLFEYQTQPLLEKLQAGDVDVAILALPVHGEALRSRLLYEEPFVLAVPEHHRLAGRKQVRVADLADETLLLLEEGHCLRDQALEVCRRTAINERQDFRATSLETLRQMVAAGAGSTLLPILASRGAYGHTRGLHSLPFAPPAPARQIGAVWRKSTTRAPAIEAVSDVLARNAGI